MSNATAPTGTFSPGRTGPSGAAVYVHVGPAGPFDEGRTAPATQATFGQDAPLGDVWFVPVPPTFADSNPDGIPYADSNPDGIPYADSNA